MDTHDVTCIVLHSCLLFCLCFEPSTRQTHTHTHTHTTYGIHVSSVMPFSCTNSYASTSLPPSQLPASPAKFSRTWGAKSTSTASTGEPPTAILNLSLSAPVAPKLQQLPHGRGKNCVRARVQKFVLLTFRQSNEAGMSLAEICVWGSGETM